VDHCADLVARVTACFSAGSAASYCEARSLRFLWKEKGACDLTPEASADRIDFRPVTLPHLHIVQPA